MKLPRRKFLHLAAGAAALPAVPCGAWAQSYPTRPVTLVVPFAAGGSPDVVARIIAPRMSELLGQQVVIENVGGASGMSGVSRVARAAPDGYQFVLGTVSTLAISQTLLKKPPYNAASDFAPVILVAEIPLILVTRKDLPSSNLGEFLAYVKRNHAKMQYGSVGAGSINHLSCALLTTSLGINVVHVPYRGGGGAIQDLVSGRIDYQCPLTPVAVSQIAGGQIKAIAILAKTRSSVLPNLATAHEQGAADVEALSWFAFFLPKGTPASIVQRLHAAANAALGTPAVKERLKELGADVPSDDRRSQDYLRQFVASETEKWARTIKASGVSTD